MIVNSDNLKEIIPRAVFPIVARINSEWQPSGTAFLVSRHGFLLAARHVIEPAARKRGRMLGPEGKFIDEGNFFALFFESRGNPPSFVSRFLSIESTTLPDQGDVAFCQLRWPPRDGPLINPLAFGIRPAPPRVGEQVFIFGYNKLDLTVVSETDDTLHVNCDSEACAVRGVVRELHIPIKDRGLASFPCFTVEVETEVIPGMSGGPVVNEAGYVCGTVSTSPSWDRMTTCAMLTLAMGLRVSVLPRRDLAARSSYLVELVRDGLIPSDGSWRQIELREVAAGVANVFLRDASR